MNTVSKGVTVKYIANYWRVCWCNKLVGTYDTREEAEAAAASLRQSKAAGEEQADPYRSCRQGREG
jgi:hypothetical protein